MAAGPEEEVTEPRGRAKPKGGRGGPGLCWGHPRLAGEQLGWSRGVGGRWDSSGGQQQSRGARHRLRDPFRAVLPLLLLQMMNHSIFPPFIFFIFPQKEQDWPRAEHPPALTRSSPMGTGTGSRPARSPLLM